MIEKRTACGLFLPSANSTPGETHTPYAFASAAASSPSVLPVGNHRYAPPSGLSTRAAGKHLRKDLYSASIRPDRTLLTFSTATDSLPSSRNLVTIACTREETCPCRNELILKYASLKGEGRRAYPSLIPGKSAWLKEPT